MSVNEILLAGIGDLTVSEAVTAEYLRLVADDRSLPNHPALIKWASINNLMSNVVKVPHAGLGGYDVAQQVAENASVPNTPLSDGSSTITVVSYAHARSASDLARICRGNVLNPAVMAQDALKCLANRKTQLICDAIDAFTLTGGTSGQNLDTGDVLAALGAAEVGNLRGPFMGVIHGLQWSDWAVDVGTLAAGAVQYHPATQELMVLRGESFKCEFLGVDWFVTNRVNSNGTDRLGAIFGPGGVVWADGTPPLDDTSQQMLIGDPEIGAMVLFERERDARARETAWVASMLIGVSLGIQNGLTLGSSAS
jgi:hypothetical protein